MSSTPRPLRPGWLHACRCCANALNGLVALNLFEKRKIGREWVFFLRAQNIAQ